MLSEFYHGTDLIRSHLDSFMAGEGVYKSMFTNQCTTIVVDNTDGSNMGLCLSCDKFCLQKEYVVGLHILKNVLESKNAKISSGIVTGRMLHNIALRAMRNMKKALALLTHLDGVSALTPAGVEYCSGITESEIKLLLLQLMFDELRGKEHEDDEEEPKTVSVSTNTKEDNIPLVTKRPSGWFFTGWFAFCQFGPFVDESDRVTIMETGATTADNKIENGRSEIRKRKLLDDDEKRINDNKNKRGSSFAMRVNMCTLELKSETIHNNKKDKRLLALTSAMQFLQKDLDRAETRAMTFTTSYDPTNEHWIKVKLIEEEAKVIKEQISAMSHCSPPPKRTKLAESPHSNNIIIDIDENCVVTTTSTSAIKKKIPPAISIDTDAITYATSNSLGSASSSK